jgi:hypothetical protein
LSNTRYSISELATAQAVGTFEAGKTVTIKIINAATDTEEVLTDDACDPLADDPTTYRWSFSNLDTLPADFTQYIYIMTDDSTTPVVKKEMVDCLGWVQAVEEGLPEADICKITANIFEADGIGAIEPNDLFDPNKMNYMEIIGSYYANQRYFKTGKYKPSLDQISDGFVYWLMPQGATVNVKVDSISVQASKLVVPNQPTIDLNDFINP